MRIGELSKISGFSKDTLRYYQQLGFFEGVVRQGENNYREFSMEALEILELIKESKLYGFTLRENKALLKIRHSKTEKLDLMEEFLKAKVLSNQQEIRRLEIQNERLLNLKSEIQRCRVQCN